MALSLALVEVFSRLVEPRVKPIPPLLSRPDFFFELAWLCSKVSVALSIWISRPASKLVSLVDTMLLPDTPISWPARTTTVSPLTDAPTWVTDWLLSMRVFWVLDSPELLVLVLR
ncbi:hypothetical protein D3C76_1632030 [compost metagenome]